MRALCVCAMLITAVAAAGAAQSLDGRQIAVEGSAQDVVFAPVSLSYDYPDPVDPVQVVDAETGRSFPATARNKQLVFIPDAIAANAKATYQVKASAEGAEPKVVIKPVEADAFEVHVNGEHFTTYHCSNDNRKPFLWPVYAEGNVTVTRNYPMGEDDPEHNDHIHHKSMWTSYGDLNGADCWGEGDNSGYQHSGAVTSGSGDAYGWIAAQNVWQGKDHKAVIDEAREYRFYASPASARTFDVRVTFTASYGDVTFRDTKEGGIMAVRIRPEIEGTREGVVTNASGATGEKACWGKPSPWCDYTGPIAGVGVRGVVVMDHRTNMRHPTCWHVRDYGLMAANCFGLSYFTRKQQNGDYVLPEGQSVTFNYRVVVHSGDAAEAKIAGRYADYVTPPEAAWVK